MGRIFFICVFTVNIFLQIAHTSTAPHRHTHWSKHHFQRFLKLTINETWASLRWEDSESWSVARWLRWMNCPGNQNICSHCAVILILKSADLLHCPVPLLLVTKTRLDKLNVGPDISKVAASSQPQQPGQNMIKCFLTPRNYVTDILAPPQHFYKIPTLPSTSNDV